MQETKNLSERFIEAADCFPPHWAKILKSFPKEVQARTQEIRLVENCPLILSTSKGLLFDRGDGSLGDKPSDTGGGKVSSQELQDCFRSFCNYSVHTHQEEIKQGFLSVKGGHRVGIGGSAVYAAGSLTGVREITSLVFRIARVLRGAAEELVVPLFGDGLCSVLIAGPPSSGKTTILRDLADQLSAGNLTRCHRVTVVDERFEIGGQGSRLYCDLLSGYHKAEGILQAVRTLAPEIIFCDEIGTVAEAEAILSGLNCGVSLVTTIHGRGLEELEQKPQFWRLMETRAFKKLVLLGSSSEPGKVKNILNIGEGGIQTASRKKFVFEIDGRDVK